MVSSLLQPITEASLPSILEALHQAHESNVYLDESLRCVRICACAHVYAGTDCSTLTLRAVLLYYIHMKTASMRLSASTLLQVDSAMLASCVGTNELLFARSPSVTPSSLIQHVFRVFFGHYNTGSSGSVCSLC